MTAGAPDRGYAPDDEAAATMRQLAAAFVDGAAEDGLTFDYSPASAAELDDFAERYLAGRPPADGVRSVAGALGAYAGEVVVRAGRGTWVLATAAEPTGDRVGLALASGPLAFPLTKAYKRLAVGEEHSLAQFCLICLTGALPPDAVRTD